MNLFEHTHAHWARYTDYQWRKASDGQAYLLPVSEAEATIYDPIPLASRLVTDARQHRAARFSQAARQ